MAGKGLYTYCICAGEKEPDLKVNGIKGGPVYALDYKDIWAVVSDVPFKQIAPSVDDVVVHNKVVESARESGVVLPIRFGTIFKNKEGTRRLLRASYEDFKSKLAKLVGKDELGVKLVLEKDAMDKIGRAVRQESAEARRVAEEASSTSKGASYFLKLKLDDIVRNETLKKIGRISEEVHGELAKTADESRVLQTELDQVVLNSVYLVQKGKLNQFNATVQEMEKKFQSIGLSFHISGPWAPYSFC
jgi:Gas vesicle synthesis protein GvpL/GvpF